jgi:hypothetical protein
MKQKLQPKLKKDAKISGMNEKSNKQELKKAVARTRKTAETLLKYIHSVKNLDDERIADGAIESYEQKLSAFEDSIKSLETDGFVSSKRLSEIVQPLTRFPNLGLMALKAGNPIEQNDLKSFEYAILKTMDELYEL